MPAKPTYEDLEARVKELEALLDRRTADLSREITEYVKVRADLETRTFELSQRLRELKAVLEISNASDQPSLRMEEFYRAVLEIIKASFHYPDIACVELKIGETAFRTTNYCDTSWKIGRGLLDGHHMIGRLTVGYLEERPERDFGPFSKEEKNLLVVLSRYLTQIIKRKQSEEQLERFQRVISQSLSMIVLTDKDGRIAYINPQLSKTLGYAPEDLIGKLHIFTPDDPRGMEIQRSIETALMEHGSYSGELEILTRDKGRIWVRAVVNPVIKHGEPEYFVGMFDDITMEMSLREQNRENQEKLDTIMENIPLSIILTDEKGRLNFINRQAEKQLRATWEEVRNKSLREVFPKEGQKAIRSLKRVYRTKKPSFDEYAYTIQGREYHFEIHRIPLFTEDGRVTQVMSIATDITRRKYEEKVFRIQQSVDSLQSIGETFEESLQALFDNLFELNWVDGGGLYLADYQAQRLRLVYTRGLSRQFVRSVKEYAFDTPNAAVVFARDPKYSSAIEFLEPTRQTVEAEKITFLTVLPLVYHDTVVGSLNLASRTDTGIDAFDRQAIEAIAQKTANLLEVINTRELLTKANEALMQQMQELREKQNLLIQKSKLESLGELSAGLAHEISQPLSVISLAFENILYKLQEHQALNEYFGRKSATINTNIDKIRQLIEHIRLFSRDQSTVMQEKVDVNQAVRNVLAMISVQLGRHHIATTRSLDAEACFVLGNPTKLEQVVMNLLSNARDAVDERERNLRGKIYMKQITITTRCEEKTITLTVEDNGTGIRPEHREKILNPFFTTKPPGQGTGLGLSIVYGIVTEMKGTIDIQSKLNKFTRMIVTFPRI